MSEIARDKGQITLYYNPDSSVGKQTLAYIQNSKVPILTINLLENTPTRSQWIEIASSLGVEVSELVLKNHPVFVSQYEKAELSSEDWLKIIRKHPEVVDQPIAIRGNKTLLVRNPTEILQLLPVKG